MANPQFYNRLWLARVITLAGLFLYFYFTMKPSSTAIYSRAKAVAAKYDIAIGYADPATFFIPPYTSQDARIMGGKATPAKVGALLPALDAMDDALKTYPKGFFARCSGAIFLCDSLTLDGAAAGGTYGKAWIILVANQKAGRESMYRTVRLGVHHEFSSLIWLRFPELQTRWLTLLPPGWKPAVNTQEALKAANRPDINPAFGFLSPYGATTAENDFNVYAEKVFTEPQKVAELAGNYPLISRKLALLMAAYTKLDSRMEPVFEKLGLAQ